jgi:hypothetical protein
MSVAAIRHLPDLAALDAPGKEATATLIDEVEEIHRRRPALLDELRKARKKPRI